MGNEFTDTQIERKLFGERLKNVIKSSGETQKSFADSIGVSLASLGYWVSGKHSPSADDLNRISQKTGCSLEWLITGSSDKKIVTTSYNLDIFVLKEILELIEKKYGYANAYDKAVMTSKIYAFMMRKRAMTKNLEHEHKALSEEIADLIELLQLKF